MTPFEIGIMLHIYCRADDPKEMNAPIWTSTRDRFIEHELIELVPASEVMLCTYRLTARGQAYVRALLSVPLPTRTWTVEWPKDVQLR